nr:glycosyltransferase family 4 protein [uncultured Rhodopila sp.]
MTHVLIIVENLPVPLDRRVWQQATALVRAGFAVSVICPKAGKHVAAFDELEGVRIYRHGLPVEGKGIPHYALEYIWAWLAELILTARVYNRRPIDIIQACNPPDNIFLIGIIFRLLFGTKFIFDHHDPAASLFALKFPRRRLLQKVVNWFERQSLRSADHVVTTSEQLRTLAIDDCGVHEARITLVRSGFDMNRVPPVVGDAALKRGRRFMALYVGIMGEQDGIDLLLAAISIIVHRFRRDDIHFVLAGGGAQLPAMKALAERLQISEHVEFTGYLEGVALYRLFTTADIGLSPDPKNDFNDKLSMNKILEYMAFGLPIIQFNLNEGRVLASDASVYAGDGEPDSFAIAITNLLDSPDRRAAMSAYGKKRVRKLFPWSRQEEIYVGLYKSVAAGRLAGKPAHASGEMLAALKPSRRDV